MIKPSPRLVLLGSIIASGIIAWWGIFFNQGTLTVQANVTNFTITGMFDTPTICTAYKCSYTVKPKIYELTISKEGHIAANTNERAIRGREVSAYAKLEAVPKFEEISAETRLVDKVYTTKSPNGEQKVWLRNKDSDKEMTTLEEGAADITELSFFPGANFIGVWFEDAESIVIDVLKQRKTKLSQLTQYGNWKFVGPTHVAWEDENRVLIGRFDKDGFAEPVILPTKNLNYVAGYDGDIVYFISQDSTNSSANIKTETDKSSILDILDSEDRQASIEEAANAEKLAFSKFSITTGETVFLSNLDWDNTDNPKLELKFNLPSLTPILVLTADGERYQLVTEG